MGGDKALADHLRIGEPLLARYMADERELPDPLLLQAVDIIIEDRQSRLPIPDQPVGEFPRVDT